MAYLDISYIFLDEGLWDALNLSAKCSENDSSDSEWRLGAKHEGTNPTYSDGISDWMAVSEATKVGVMELWLIDSPDPKTNASWANLGPLQSFCTCRCSFFEWLLEWVL